MDSPINESKGDSASDPELLLGSKSDLVWHYTNPAGLVGIVKSGVLWGSAPAALNDLSEMEHGMRFIVNEFKNRERDVPLEVSKFFLSVLSDVLVQRQFQQTFVVSASMEEDVLTLWRNYASNTGFAIGLRHGGLWGRGVEEEKRGQRQRIPRVIDGWQPVIYEPARKEAMAHDVVSRVIDRYHMFRERDDDEKWRAKRDIYRHVLLTPLIEAAAVMKHSSFVDEREVRLVATRNYSLPEFRATESLIIPYVEIGSLDRDEVATYRRGLLPIKRIRCSPGMRDGMLTTVRQMLDAHGYGKPIVEKSNIPFYPG